MLNKISNAEVIKAFVANYTVIKEAFKDILKEEGFIWNKAWERHHFSGSEGVWFNPVSKISLRIRWGKTNSSAIIYIEKEFYEKIVKFIDHYIINEGIDYPDYDYELLNQGKVIHIIERAKKIESILGTENLIEGDLAYLEREKNGGIVRIVVIGGVEKRVKINKLNDFLNRSRFNHEIKEELKLLIANANVKWSKK